MITTTLVGIIMHTPRPRNTRAGERVLNLDVAVRQRIKKDGSWQNETLWVDVVIFGERADGLAQVVKKGGQIGAAGELRIRHYTGRDGTAKVGVELYASNVWPLNWQPRDREEPASPSDVDADGHLQGLDEPPF